MNYFKTLDAFQSNIALYTENAGTVTYGEMLRQADEMGGYVQTRSLVFILCSNTIESVTGYLAVMRADSVPLLLDKSIQGVFLAQLMNAFKPHFVYMSKKSFETLSAEVHPLATSSVVYANGSYVLASIDVDTPYPLHEDLALLLTTSGSTGTQKLVRQSYKNIHANAHSIATYLNITSDDRAITTLPMSYTYGLSIIQSHLLMGASIILTDASVLEKRFWDTVKEYKATTMGGVPYTFEMLKRIGFEDMNLEHMRYITQAGGKLSKELSTYFAQACLKKNIRFIVMYGQVEATARMSYLPWEVAVQKAGSIGIPIPGGTMYLLDENGNRIESAHIPGELIYEGDNVTLGYAHSCNDLAQDDENNGTLHTGDIAQRDEEGYYYIVGRLNRFSKILGKRINLDEIETWLRNRGHDCACVGNDDDLRVYVTSREAVQDIDEILHKTFGLRRPFTTVHYIDKIPRNASNKIQYAALL